MAETAPAPSTGPKQDQRTGRFLPGNKSGGRPKMPEELKEAFKKASPKALKVLKSIMADPEAKDADRIRAAEAILDRGYGKPPVAVQVEAEDSGLGVVVLPAIQDDDTGET